METVELESLVGLHYLSGVDRTTTRYHAYGDVYEDAAVLNFVLDGKTYSAIEDTNDGYRSMLDEIRVSDEKLDNIFERVAVFVIMRHKQDYQEDRVLDFYDVFNNKIVLSIGTANWGEEPFCTKSSLRRH